MTKTKTKTMETKARIDGVVKGDHYETTNLHLAVWFHINDKHLVDIDKSNTRRAIFVFDDFPEREKLISEFYTKEEIQRFIAGMQYIKVKLYQDTPPVRY